MPNARFVCACVLVACLACRDERAPHVFHAPAPQRPALRVDAPVEERPDVPFGSTGADARISAVSNAATGAPTVLGDARGSIIVMATFARGPAWSSTEPLEVQLVLTGACPGIVVATFPAPAPVVIAHQFRITASDIAAWCTRDGVTMARAVLLGRNARALAASVPMGLTIRR